MSHFVLNVALIDVFGVQKKLYKLSKLGGGGGGGNLDKIQKNSNFFFVKPSLTSAMHSAYSAPHKVPFEIPAIF